MSLKNELSTAMKEAMRAKNKTRLGAIRLMLSEIKRVEVDERITVNDERVNFNNLMESPDSPFYNTRCRRLHATAMSP